MSFVSDYLEQNFEEVDYKTFYRYIFPDGSLQTRVKDGQLRTKEEYDALYAAQKGLYNAIAVAVTNDRYTTADGKEKPVIRRYTVTDDLEVLDELVASDDFCLMAPISYAGKTRHSSNAREIYALAFDIDGILSMELEDGTIYARGLANLCNMIDNLDMLPEPTFIVSSGSGVHLYYVLEEPIPYFDNIVKELEKLKKELTRLMWYGYVTKLEDKVQYEPVCQGFRVVGTITKSGERCRAFRYGNCKPVSIEYLNKFVRPEYQAKDFVYRSDLPLAIAKTKYPDWYQKRIVEKQPRGTWQFNRAVYDRWLERLKDHEMTVGHRYWSMWVLAVTAMKCGISQEELERDAFSLIDVMNEIDENKVDPFTTDDVLAALEGYDKCWITYPIDKMEYRTDMRLDKTKRNFRKREVHLERARAVQKIDYPNNEWAGRKPKKDVVLEWRMWNPDGKKADCIRDTGLSKPTVYKWWSKKGSV